MNQPISAKVAHVKGAKQTRDHTCHWPGCEKQVKPAMWGCTHHWFSLPQKIRARIWNAYRIGQEGAGRVSEEYVAAAREAQDWIREHRSNGGA